MLSRSHPSNHQRGMMLLEGLIAILIFSLGIIALIGMQATATKQVTDAKYRTDAAFLANQLIGTMWMKVEPSVLPTNLPNPTWASDLKAEFDTDANTSANANDDLNKWKSAVASALPGVTSATQPTVNVAAGTSTDGVVTITIQWLPPGTPGGTPHQYVSIAQVKK
jgi:type IV pilus assembly protein PilV